MAEQSLSEQHLETVLDTVQEYLNQQKQIEEILKEAYFNLAKAKYGAVNTGLGPTLYNMDMKASRTVHIQESEAGLKCFEFIMNQGGDKSQEDPITWFGAMPSQSLRQAQKGFVSALEEITALAKMKTQLRDNLRIQKDEE